MKALLISTSELGHQPVGLASPAAWLRDAGADVACCDASLEKLDEDALTAADFVGIYLPMHTATRIAVPVIRRLRELNRSAHLCAYGLYAPMNEGFLRKLGIDSVVGGEFEGALVGIVRALGARKQPDDPPTRHRGSISLAKQEFRVPERAGLQSLKDYACLTLSDGTSRVVGYTEASRGCKHLCRHCPVVPVYNGRFFVVQRDVVLADIRQQVEAGAQHITFGDPDFFNGVGHAVALVEALHREHPALTYDVTIKIEHLLKHADALPRLRDTGCLFVTAAVESLDDRVLDILDKGHTRADFFAAVALCRDVGLGLVPTFVTFTPWSTLTGYEDLLDALARLGLVGHVAPIQLAIRLLIPKGSLLLELAEVRDIIGPFDEAALCYPWDHPDPRVDLLYRDVQRIVQEGTAADLGRDAIFAKIWSRLQKMMDRPRRSAPALGNNLATAAVPYLSEPWYCCAEPTEDQVHAY